MLVLKCIRTKVDGCLSPWVVVDGAGAGVEATFVGIGGNVGKLRCRLNDLLRARNDWRRRSAGSPDVEQVMMRTWSLELVIGDTREGGAAACVVVDVLVRMVLPLLSLEICCCHCLEKRF